jgi:DNA anti-recombination protein RmuC
MSEPSDRQIMDGMIRGFSEVRQDIRDVEDRINDRFDGMDEKLDGVDEKIDNMDGSINGKIDRVASEQTALLKKIECKIDCLAAKEKISWSIIIVLAVALFIFLIKYK